MTTLQTDTRSGSNTWTTTCGCQWADTANHNALLMIEADFGIVANLVTQVAQWADLERDPNLVAVCDLAGFATEHNWRNPVAVQATFHALTDLASAERIPGL